MFQRFRIFCFGVGALCVVGAAFSSCAPEQRPQAMPLIAAKRHFLARCVVLWGLPNQQQPLDVEGIVISPNGRAVAAWVDSPDPFVELSPLFWDIATKKRLPYSSARNKWFVQGNVDGVHQTPAGLTGVVTEKSFDLRDKRTGKIVRRFNAPTKSHCTAWTFSPDGKTLWWADEQQRIFWQSVR